MTDGLRAIVLRDEEDTLVVQATPAQVAQFGARSGDAVMLRRQRPRSTVVMGGIGFVSGGTRADAAHDDVLGQVRGTICARDGHNYLYDKDGHPVAFITRLRQEMIDVTRYGDVSAQYLPSNIVSVDVVVLDGVQIV